MSVVKIPELGVLTIFKMTGKCLFRRCQNTHYIPKRLKHCSWFVNYFQIFVTLWSLFNLIVAAQWTREAMITSSLRQNDVAASFWHNNDVTIASYVRWEIVYSIVVCSSCLKYTHLVKKVSDLSNIATYIILPLTKFYFAWWTRAWF